MGELADIEAKSPIEVMFPGKNAIFINIQPLKSDYIILEITITSMIILLILSISTLLLVLVIIITD